MVRPFLLATRERHMELVAARWRVPESWVRNRTRVRTPKEERIPCVRLGRYVRFEWGSPKLQEWLEKSANIERIILQHAKQDGNIKT